MWYENRERVPSTLQTQNDFTVNAPNECQKFTTGELCILNNFLFLSIISEWCFALLILFAFGGIWTDRRRFCEEASADSLKPIFVVTIFFRPFVSVTEKILIFVPRLIWKNSVERYLFLPNRFLQQPILPILKPSSGWCEVKKMMSYSTHPFICSQRIPTPSVTRYNKFTPPDTVLVLYLLTENGRGTSILARSFLENQEHFSTWLTPCLLDATQMSLLPNHLTMKTLSSSHRPYLFRHFTISHEIGGLR